jgi:delta 1-pyrroline-5-carboxylate dehydrogenase
MLRASSASLLKIVGRQPTGRYASTFVAPQAHTVASFLKDASLLKNQAHFGGKWSDAADKKTFDVLDPATGNVIGTVPKCGIKETQQAIDSAHSAQVGWAKLTGKERGLVLRRWYDLMVANKDDLATILTIEAGKPVAEALGEIAYASSFFDWFAGIHMQSPPFFFQIFEPFVLLVFGLFLNLIRFMCVFF